ncbi:MAG TPA: cupin domain-containing protein [Chitinophagaceae bacterium]
MKVNPELYLVNDDGVFPNNMLPILYYPKALELPKLFAGGYVRNLFAKNNWSNNWKAGIYTYHHYHSVTHEVIGIIKGETLLQLGGEQGITLFVEKGDVLVIPAGVAHMNLGKENDVTCIGGYPGGKDYDMKYGHAGERPPADENIATVPLPATDPIYGEPGGLKEVWKA